MQYANPPGAPDQVNHLRAELAKKKLRIAELQHEVDATDNHRRQVQAHNHDLEEQLNQTLHMLQVS
jgi:septal ring factor EnvC (AmiA/AmiB activator)